jgi:hypothetical protein
MGAFTLVDQFQHRHAVVGLVDDRHLDRRKEMQIG